MPAKTEKGQAAFPPPETVASASKTVACDGGGPLGHPRVFLNLGEAGEAECPYCDRRFVLKEAAGRAKR